MPLVRLAHPSDAGAIASVLGDAFTPFRSLYSERGFEATVIAFEGVLARMCEGPVWVAEIGDAVVGTVGAVRTADGLNVRGMAVVPSARGRGCAGTLLREAERFGTAAGLTRVFLSTTPFLHAAIRLYERAGYRIVAGSEHDLFGTPLVRMEKILAPQE